MLLPTHDPLRLIVIDIISDYIHRVCWFVVYSILSKNHLGLKLTMDHILPDVLKIRYTSSTGLTIRDNYSPKDPYVKEEEAFISTDVQI